MLSFARLTVFFLAGVCAVASIPAGDLAATKDADSAIEEASANANADADSTNGEDAGVEADLNDPNTVNVLDAVSSIAELSDDQRRELQKPLDRLTKNFDGTLFGSLFSYISKRLQNPTEFAPSEVNEVEMFKKTPLALKSFISTLQKLSDKVIEDSQPQFDEILAILGDARFAVLFREILLTLKMRRVLFQYVKSGDKMLENLPGMLADAGKFDMKNVQQLIQNPGSIAALMPGAAEMRKYAVAALQTPKAADGILEAAASSADSTPHPVHVINAAKNISNRVRLNTVPRVSVPRISSIQQRMQQNLPPYRPAAILDTRNTMTV